MFVRVPTKIDGRIFGIKGSFYMSRCQRRSDCSFCARAPGHFFLSPREKRAAFSVRWRAAFSVGKRKLFSERNDFNRHRFSRRSLDRSSSCEVG